MAAVAQQARADTSLGAEPPVPAEPGSKRRFGWYLALTLFITAVIFAAAGVVNYRLNPLVYNRQAIHDAAAALTAGQNYANYDPNINWRALRREQIKQWTSTPDVIVFGGSRWWE